MASHWLYEIFFGGFFMTETTVNFLTQVVNGSTVTYPVSTRVFSAEVDQASLNVYTSAIETLQNAQNGLGWDGIRYTVPLTSAQQEATIDAVTQLLNTWSLMKQVDGAVEGYSTGAPAQTPPDGYIHVSGLNATTSVSNGVYTYTINSLNPLYLGSVAQYLSPLNQSTLSLTSTMNRYMGESVDQIVRTMRAAGWDPISGYGNANRDAAYTQLFDPTSVYQFQSVLQNAYNVTHSAQVTGNSFSQSDSIQQVLMVDYVVAGNAMLFNEMSSLQEAINLNQQSLTYLNSLQDLMNQKTPQQFIMQLQDLATSNPQYSQFEKDTFNQTLTNIPDFTNDEVANYVALISSGVTSAGYPADATFVSDSSQANPANHIYYVATISPCKVTPNDLRAIQEFKFQNSLTNIPATSKFVGDPSQNNPANAVWYVAGLGTNDSVTEADLQALYEVVPGYQPDSIYVSDSSQADPTNHIYHLTTTKPSYVSQRGLLALNTYLINSGTTPAPGTEFVGDLSLADPSKHIVYSSNLGQNEYVYSDDIQNLINQTTASYSGTSTSGYPTDAQFTGDASAADASKHIYYVQGMASGAFVSLSDLNASNANITSAYQATANQIIANLQYLQNQVTALGGDAAPLATQIGVVIKDFQDLPKDYDGVNLDLTVWTKDYSDNQGLYQTHLNDAVIASQSLNDTEREKLQEAMFVYQEFYQSATSMLSDLNQLIQTMAQNIR
jgi:hypothetical protein